MSKATVNKAHREAEALELFERQRPETARSSRNESQRGETQLRHSAGEVEEAFVDGYLAGSELRGAEGKTVAWVACSERLPERREWVILLLADKKQPYRIAYWDDRDNGEPAATQAPFWCDDDSWFGDVGDADLIRGWQPLPPPPSSEASK